MNFKSLFVLLPLLAALAYAENPSIEAIEAGDAQEAIEDANQDFTAKSVSPACEGETCKVSIRIATHRKVIPVIDDDTVDNTEVPQPPAPVVRHVKKPKKVVVVSDQTDDAEAFDVAQGMFIKPKKGKKIMSFDFDEGASEDERFAIRQPHRGRCLSIETNFRSKYVLRALKCAADQHISFNSRITFHFKRAESNLWLLAWTTPSGRELCAKHRWLFGTEFYKCGAHSTRYSLGATDEQGRFAIKSNSKANACMSHFYGKTVNMVPCTDSTWQKFTKIPAVRKPKLLTTEEF